jgi:transcriptional regulator with XRE-family HTH domain
MGQIRDKLLLKKIALTIKSLREERNETQDDVYVATNIHIGRIETARANISVSTLASLCTYFKISLVEFFKRVDYDK